MVAEMSYESVSNVMESWEGIKKVKDYETAAGVKLFRRFFEYDPSAAQVFSFGKSTKLDDKFYKSPELLMHAKYFISMIERAINLLGPDIELLTEILLDLGKKHATLGVQPSHYVPMGRALLFTLEEMLPDDKFTDEIKDSWLEVYQALSYDMVRGHNLKQ